MVESFIEASFNTNWDEVDVEALKREVDTFKPHLLKLANSVLADFGFGVSDDILKAVLKTDLELAWEVFTGGITDTSQTDQFCDLVLQYIDLSHWPMYGDSDQYTKEFHQKLNQTFDIRKDVYAV